LQDDRFRLIWALLIWEGTVGNARLRQLLPLETVQVSRLLTSFAYTFPTAAIWDRASKRYKATGDRPPSYPPPNLDEYLAIVEKLPEALPWLDRVVSLAPKPDATVFASIQGACARKTGLSIEYASLSKPTGTDRLVFPHAMAQVGMRWIVRAWCPRRESYIDLMLDRITRSELSSSLPPVLPTDERWHSKTDLRLKVHDQLPRNYARLVQRYRFNGAITARLSVRKALIPYVLLDVRAALNPDIELPPMFELQVANPLVIAPFQFPKLQDDGDERSVLGGSADNTSSDR
uniref:WYL domain-containing protein n=1 Tax=uncultured Nevskia sp. TaxID=228950 RepID=UPI0025F51CA1